MSGRVEREIPGLPPCVVTSLVKKLDADDLDLLICHPAGLAAQVGLKKIFFNAFLSNIFCSLFA